MRCLLVADAIQMHTIADAPVLAQCGLASASREYSAKCTLQSRLAAAHPARNTTAMNLLHNQHAAEAIFDGGIAF